MNASRHRRTRRVVASIAGLAAASLALSACIYSLIPEARPTPTSSATPDTEGVAAELLPFYGQKLDWETCNETFQCATVTAPLDWENPSAAEIELAIIRHPAESGHAQGSLLVNPGGPGASGLSTVRDSVEGTVGEPVRAVYDVIGFDPRGVGESTAVVCYDAAGMDEYLYGIPQNPRGSDAWTAEVEGRNRDFAEACDANSDGILPYITTVNAARDLDLLRAVLGDKQLHYLGYSYGTLLGATFAGLYPDKVGRLVFDGAVDPSITRLEDGVAQAIGFEKALRAYMADCLKGSECPFRGSVDDALADLGTLLATVDADPLRAADGRELGADTLMTATLFPLYSRAFWEYLTIALTDVLAGDPEVAFILADSYYQREDGAYLNNLSEAFRTYSCLDNPHDETPEEVAAADERIRDGAPTIAPYWLGPDPCDDWLYPASGVNEPIAAEGADPIVIVGSTGDPATPYEQAVALADQLSSGVLITRVGEGHTGYNQGIACIDDAVNDYFINGTVPEDGLRCE